MCVEAEKKRKSNLHYVKLKDQLLFKLSLQKWTNIDEANG